MRIPYSSAALLLLLACTGTSAPPKAPDAAPSSMPTMEPPKVPEAPADATDDGAPTAPGDVVEVPTQDPATDAAALYAQCEGRLEQPEGGGGVLGRRRLRPRRLQLRALHHEGVCRGPDGHVRDAALLRGGRHVQLPGRALPLVPEVIRR